MEYIILKWISSLCILVAINLDIDKQPDWITVKELEETNPFIPRPIYLFKHT